MRLEIRIGGFGGQGVITMGHILGTAASLHLGFEAVMTESYGPEARGGACKTDLVISDVPIDYPKTTSLDCLVAMNPDAYNSYKGDVRRGGVVIYDSGLFGIEDRSPGIRYVGLPATSLAAERGNPQVANVVMLGALLKRLPGLCTLADMEAAIGKAVSSRNAKLNEVNVRALRLGFEAA